MIRLKLWIDDFFQDVWEDSNLIVDKNGFTWLTKRGLIWVCFALLVTTIYPIR